MTREMYESLALTDLRGIAKQRGMKIPAKFKKADIVELMLLQDQNDASAKRNQVREAAPVITQETAAASNAGDKGTTEDSTEKAAERSEDSTAKTAKRSEKRAGKASGRSKESTAKASGRSEEGSAKASERNKEGNSKETGRNAEKPVRRKYVRKNDAKGQEPAASSEPAQLLESSAVNEQPSEDAAEAADMEKEAGMMAREEYGKGRVQEQLRSEAAPFAKAQAAPSAAAQNVPAAASQNTPAAAAAQNAPSAAAQTAPVPQNSSLDDRYARRGLIRPDQAIVHKNDFNKDLDSGEMANGILEVMPDGYGFIRSANYMPGDNDVYVAPSQIRRFNLKTGDIIQGNIRIKTQSEKFSALLFVKTVNGLEPEAAKKRFNFEDMTPVFPDDKIRLEKTGASIAMRVMDLMAPVGKGQRGMIVSPPKAGKTTLVKEIAKSVTVNNPEIHLIILLIDERPEEVTDIKEAIKGDNVEVIYSTFDELPEHHKRVSEMVIERAKRLVEQKRDVMILLDSITRLTRAYNLTEPSSGRTLSGGLDPAALHMPKRFFGAARNMREGGSLTILATALIETGSKMDDVVYEEFKGTGNMELILNRKLSERRIFPAVDLAASGTRRDDLLLTPDEMEAVSLVRRAFIGSKAEEATDSVLDLFYKTRSNGEFVSMIRKHQWSY